VAGRHGVEHREALGDDLRASVDRVAHFPTTYLVGSIVACTVILVLQGCLMLGFRAPQRSDEPCDVPHPRLVALTMVVIGVAFAALLLWRLTS